MLLTATVATSAVAGTLVKDETALRRLQGNSGVTLQWIGFETARRGHMTVRSGGGTIHLSGRQDAVRGAGRLTVEGDIVAIDATGFTLRGRIAITDTPDVGRRCVRDGLLDFRVTGERRYWRLQQMEACGDLTDYVDIYY